MSDKGRIIIGLLIGLFLFTFPFWYNMGKAAPKPDPQLTPEAKAAKVCVRPISYMKNNHMQLLDEWRDDVVRNGERFYQSENGQTYEMSLQNTCMKCHWNKSKFCDQCHNYQEVAPFCWDCHLEPKEKK